MTKPQVAHATQQVSRHAAKQAALHHLAIMHEKSTDPEDVCEQHEKQRTSNDMVKRPNENEQVRHHTNSKLPEHAADIKMIMSNQGPANSGSLTTMETVADGNYQYEH